jgi:hypothetical protein
MFGAAFAAAPVNAANAPAQKTVSHEMKVDITETPKTGDKSGPRVVHMTIPITENAGSSNLAAQIGTIMYKVQAKEGPASLMSFEISRIAPSGTVLRTDLSLESTTVLAAGQKITVGRVEAPDGSATEVTAELP